MKWSPEKLIAGSIAILAIAHVGHCSYVSQTGQRNFKNVREGDSLDHVMLTMGEPSRIQAQGDDAPNGYGKKDCNAPCVQRVWYLNRGSMVGEAWSFDVDDSGKLMQTGYWVSP